MKKIIFLLLIILCVPSVFGIYAEKICYRFNAGNICINENGFVGVSTSTSGNSTAQIINAVNGTALNGTNFKSIQWNNIVGKIISWTDILSKPFNTLSSWFEVKSNVLYINETKLNSTIKALDNNETTRVNALYNSNLTTNARINTLNSTKLNIIDQRYNNTNLVLNINTTTNTRIDTLQTGLSGNATKLDNLQVSFLSNVTKIDNIYVSLLSNVTKINQNEIDIDGLIVSNTTTNNRINTLNSTKLNIIDQRYNETQWILNQNYLNSVPQSFNQTTLILNINSTTNTRIDNLVLGNSTQEMITAVNSTGFLINWSNIISGNEYYNQSPITLSGYTFGLMSCPDTQVLAYNTTYGNWQCQPKSSTGGGTVTSVSGDGKYVKGTITSSGSFTFNESQLNSTILSNIILSDYLKGEWNATTNTPELVNGVGSNGDVYIVKNAGTRNFGIGNVEFKVGDWIYFNGYTEVIGDIGLTGYVDPNEDVSVEWYASVAGDHYEILNHGVRQPTAIDTLSEPYIHINDMNGLEDVFKFTALSNVGNVNSVTVWAFGYTGSQGGAEVTISKDGINWETPVEILEWANSEERWENVTFDNLDWTQEELDNIHIKLISTRGFGGGCYIYALYVIVDYDEPSFNGAWEKQEGVNRVYSVNGQQGVVQLTLGNTTQEMINAVNTTGFLINWSNVITDTNESTRVNALLQSNISTNARINTLNSTKLNIIDQRYNDTAKINAVNTSSNIKSLGFNLTSELKTYFDTLYYGITNINNYVSLSTVVASIGNWTLDKVNYYTKSQVYNKTETYTKTEVNNLPVSTFSNNAGYLTSVPQSFNQTTLILNINATTNARINNLKLGNTTNEILTAANSTGLLLNWSNYISSSGGNTTQEMIIAVNTTGYLINWSKVIKSFVFSDNFNQYLNTTEKVVFDEVTANINGTNIKNMDINCIAGTYQTGINFTDESLTCTALPALGNTTQEIRNAVNNSILNITLQTPNCIIQWIDNGTHVWMQPTC